MKDEDFKQLIIELSVKAKNGINFTLAASIIWFLIYFVWKLDYDTYTKCIFVFCTGAPLLPLAFVFSKIFKTEWKIPSNPLQSLGLWLNFAQLIYFPSLIFVMLKIPDYFIMTYAITTGAHLFPYSWFYGNKIYAVIAVAISLGSLILGLKLNPENMSLLAMFTSLSLLVLTVLLYFDFKKKQKNNPLILQHGN